MQLLFEKDYIKNQVYCLPNGGIYPTEEEIDEMIEILLEIKSLGNEVILRHNQEIWNHIHEDVVREKPLTKRVPGYIYVLKSNNLYKIGRARNIEGRLKTYRTENPFGIEVVLYRQVDDYIETEKGLLKKFEDKKVRGEWFDLSLSVAVLIQQALGRPSLDRTVRALAPPRREAIALHLLSYQRPFQSAHRFAG
jgi:T5orf172 domain